MSLGVSSLPLFLPIWDQWGWLCLFINDLFFRLHWNLLIKSFLSWKEQVLNLIHQCRYCYTYPNLIRLMIGRGMHVHMTYWSLSICHQSLRDHSVRIISYTEIWNGNSTLSKIIWTQLSLVSSLQIEESTSLVSVETIRTPV